MQHKTSTTRRVICPCGCGEVVAATDAGFAATTTVEVKACTAQSRSLGAVSFTMRKTRILRDATPAELAAHRDGLVIFGGAR